MTLKTDRPSRSKSQDFLRKKRREDEEFAPTVEDGLTEWQAEQFRRERNESRDQKERQALAGSGWNDLGK
jgi:hypothetical protein